MPSNKKGGLNSNLRSRNLPENGVEGKARDSRVLIERISEMGVGLRRRQKIKKKKNAACRGTSGQKTESPVPHAP